MTAHQTISATRWALPPLLALLGLIAQLRLAPLSAQTAFAAFAGAAVGVLLAQVLGTLALLLSHLEPTEVTDDLRLRMLQQNKLLLLRTIREIEFDAELKRIDPEEAERLAQPVKQRAMRILRQLDELKAAGEDQTTDQQIEQEVRRRLRLDLDR